MGRIPREFGALYAWVLLSIIYAGEKKKAEMKDIIAMADYINHAIPTYGEFLEAVIKLQESGLIKSHQNTFTETELVVNSYASIKNVKSISRQLEKIEEFLGKLKNKPEAISHTAKELSRQEFEIAVEAYLNSR